MIRKLVVLLVIATLLTSCATSTNSKNDSIGYVAADGSAVLRDISERGDAIELTGKFLNGENWKLSEYRGQVLILNAWGPWCAPCRSEVPELQKLQDANFNNGLRIFGMATRTTSTAVLAFTDKYAITYSQIADYDSAIVSQIKGVPSATVPGTIFIDKLGRVAGFALGAADISLIRSLTKSLLEE